MIGSYEGGGLPVHRLLKARLVSGRKIETSNPKVTANERQIANDRHVTQNWQPFEEPPAIDEAQDPHQREARARLFERPCHETQSKNTLLRVAGPAGKLGAAHLLPTRADLNPRPRHPM